MKYILPYLTLLLFTTNLLFSNINTISNFVENSGQWDEDILFSLNNNGIVTNITSDGIYFDFFKINSNKIIGDVIRMELENSTNFNIKPINKQENNINYFIGNDPDKWVRNVSTYEKIVFENVYSGINLELLNHNNSPRYDFVVEPYADPSQISIIFDGVNSISTDNKKLIINTLNSVIENKNLLAYQIIDGNKQLIPCEFKLINNKISFDLGNYDNSKKLVIDPVVYSSYFGGNGDEKANVVKFIDDKTIVLGGTTTSNDLKTTVGSYNEEYGDRGDGFLTKLRIENSEYIPSFTTFIGSLELDEIIDLEIDNDFILVTGNTRSSDFPMVKAFKSQFGGKSDIFVSSIGLNGDTLLQSSFYGGSGDDVVIEVNKDNNNTYLFGGITNSNNIQVLGGPPNSNYKGDKDILLFSVNSNRSSVSLSAYVGGLRDDILEDMYIDKFTREILITGYTYSSTGSDLDFPNYPKKRFGQGGPYDETLNGNKDAFVIQLLQGAQNYKISTYIGGDGDDIGKGVWLNDKDEIFVIGETYSNKKSLGFPVTIGDNNIRGNADIFIAKFNKLATSFGGVKTQSLGFSRVHQSQGNDIISKFVRPPDGIGLSILLSTNGEFPELTTSNMKQKQNIILSALNTSDGGILESTLFGGSDDDFPTYITYDSFDNYLIAGFTKSSDFETTTNSSQNELSGVSDIVLIRNNKSEMSFLNPQPNQILCVGSVVSVQWSGDKLSSEAGYDIGYMINNNPNTFQSIISDLEAESYNWTIPESLSGEDSITIRVSHSSGAFSQNENFFSVNETAKINSFELMTEDTICIGDSIVFNANSIGTNVEYVLYKDDIEIERSAENVFKINSVNVDDIGTYKVSVVNECPPQSFSENSISVFVSQNTKAGSLPESITKKKGEVLELNTDSKGVELIYEWYKDDSVVPSQKGSTLTLSNLSLNDAGNYKCIVTGKCGIDTSNVSIVNVEDVIGNVKQQLTEIAEVNINSDGTVNIEIKNSTLFNLNLYNNDGSLISQINSKSNSIALDLNNNPSGIYWLIVEINDKLYKHKISYLK